MALRGEVVRLSSKGQIVIPARLRRRMGWKSGQALRVGAGKGGQVVLSPVGVESVDIEAMRDRARKWADETGRDLVAELHERRRQEREKEERDRRGD